MAELRLYDRSRVTTDWNCGRKRYLQYEVDGKGVVSGNTHLELYTGTVIHDGLAAIAHQYKDSTPSKLINMDCDIDLIATTARKQMVDALLAQTTGEIDEIDFANEQGSLVEGILRGFYKHVWPRLISQYPNILHIEEEMTYDHDGLIFMSKPDLVVADNEGIVAYIEYKSTSSKKEGWVNSWATAVQLHSTVRAIKATTGLDVTNVIVQGLYKGFESYGKQSSPFCYAYRRNGTPPFSETETRYDYKAGFKRVPTWELPGGVAAWVDSMPFEVLADQFPQAPPIFVDDVLLDNFFYQRAMREHEIAMAVAMMEHADEVGRKNILNTAFPQRFDQCHPYFGKACQYLKICHGRVEEPLAEGFTYREPHHALEVEQWKETSVSSGLINDSVN